VLQIRSKAKTSTKVQNFSASRELGISGAEIYASRTCKPLQAFRFKGLAAIFTPQIFKI
jgi:hypothetical protein